MKTMLALLLAMIMCLSLVACGGENSLNQNERTNASENKDEIQSEETENANTETEIATETVEITDDNWQEYFEIRVLAEIRTNDFDEIDGMMIDTFLVLKDDYADRYVSADGAVEVKKGGQNSTSVTYNLKTEELTLSHSNEVSEKERTYTVSLENYEERGLDLNAGNGTTPGTLEQNGNILTAISQFYKFVEITRIKGNLCLKK